MSTECGELKVKSLLNPTEREILEKIPFVTEIIVFTETKITDLQEQLIQRELANILGSNYKRAFVN